MFSKIIKNFRNISEISLKTMFYGTKLALGVLVVGVLAYFYNEYFLGNRYLNSVFCIAIVQSGFSLFVQFIIGGIIADCIRKKS